MKEFPNTLQALLKGGLNIHQLRPAINADSPQLRVNGVLRKEEWKAFDERVVQVARDIVTGVDDLRAAGLVRNLGGLGVMTDEWETSSDMTGANIDMAGVTPGQEDSATFTLHGVPIPIIHKDFRVNIRRLEASRKLGTPIDTFQAGIAARRVIDAVENMLFNGASIKSDGYTIYGYLNHPNRNVITTSQDWGTPANIHASVRAMIAAAEADNMFGPYMLYVNKTQYAETRAPEGVDRFMTVRERIMQMPEIRGIKRTQAIPAGTAVLVQLTEDVVDLALGQDIVTVQWETDGGMMTHFKVMTALAPRIKADDDGRSGIVVHTGI